ncbi:hypothetical protein CLV24_13811 [Pontibacter ummariensis]|uniref:Uncharacterized protein n=1 Tax=Pontibacter ummariensis TaxID=1610492 RepID=A0A239LBY9_9BACT|nr:hypothetical protein [Pontibacter ummariensis]PRY03946.1 hypothetical protein CLV24_13811 [Pontibacter ummariensis]SNT27438.1 hypothetical protein SAMN06296052_13822 [Pontibacter ummariensis]
MPRLFGYVLWLYGHRGSVSSIAFKQGERVAQEQLQGITKEELLELIIKATKQNHRLRLYPEPSLAVVEINSYGNVPKSKAFTDSCFQVIKHHGLENVALDLRKNGEATLR